MEQFLANHVKFFFGQTISKNFGKLYELFEKKNIKIFFVNLIKIFLDKYRETI